MHISVAYSWHKNYDLEKQKEFKIVTQNDLFKIFSKLYNKFGISNVYISF